MSLNDLLSQSKQKRLHLHPYWHKLMHYRTSLGGIFLRSDIYTKRYFLSPSGDTDSNSEIEATIRAFFSPAPSNPNDHPQCRFRSRYLWLREALDWTKTPPPHIECSDFNQWTHELNIKSLSIIFATGYLGNPASYFGHPLLKLNFKDDETPDDLLNTSINFGAFTPPNVNPIAYPFKGVFGGYKAGFTHVKFHYHDHNYTENELRDLWEYTLILTKDQIAKIIAHAWDLFGIEFPYYFLHNNCASRMAELLEMGIDHKLMPQNVPYAIPYTLFDRLYELQLTTQPRLIPSRQTKLTQKYQGLSKNDQTIVKKVIQTKMIVPELQKDSSELTNKAAIIETLFDYISFISAKNDHSDDFDQIRRELLSERAKLPVGHIATSSIQSSPPHLWQRPVLTQLGAFSHSKYKEGMSLRLRPAYYDILSPDISSSPNGTLSTFDFKFSYAKEKLFLNHVNIIEIQTLNISQTDLAGDGGLSWNFKLSYENPNLSCYSCMALVTQGGIGKAQKLGPFLIGLITVNPRLSSKISTSEILSVEPKATLLLHTSDFWKSYLSLSRLYYLTGDRSSDEIYAWENRFGLSRSWDLRTSVKKFIEKNIEISLSHYW